MSSIFNITHQANLGKHLGCPVFKGRLKTEALSDLVIKTAAKLQTWKIRHVYKTGRVTLIQSHIESMFAHTMQRFQLPKEISHQIDNISRDFFLEKVT